MKNNDGAIGLIAMLIVSAVALAIGISLLQISTSSTKSSLSHQQSTQAKSLADTCGDVALNVIKNNNPYTGSANVVLGEGDCDYTVTSGSGGNRTIATEGHVSNVVRKVTITTDAISPQVNISSWQETP
ncbi:MAG: hypothetical protein M3P98_02155 [bacterium]|nr:hypothetical protein [bacterium]